MAEARAICSRGWALTLLGLVCCAAEADVLSDSLYAGDEFPPAMDAETATTGGAGGTAGAGGTPGGVMVSNDAGFWWDAEVPLDAGAAYPTPLDASKGPTWTECDLSPDGSLVARARTGDPCQFKVATGCATHVSACEQINAFCVNGVLQLGKISKDVCEPDDLMNARRCDAMETADCCVSLWQCDGSTDDPTGQPKVRVCALSCEMQPTYSTQAAVTGCPNDPDSPAWPRSWPPPLGLPCEGNFICDSMGSSVGPSTAFQLDEAGMIYWCENKVVQRAAMGLLWPWNTEPF